MPDNKERLVQWLRDAHAMEKQAETMLQAQASRLENYPELRGRIERHLEETRRQTERLEGCLDRLGVSRSMIKDVAGTLAASAQGLGGVFAGDEVVKGAMAGYVFEHMEIASYNALMAAAEEAGQPEVVRICRINLEEEQAMADWLKEHLPGVVQTFLRRELANAPAKR